MNKFCPSCGNALEEGQKFCGKCGNPAQGSGTGAAGSAQTGAPIAANANITHLLLCIFLGCFGAHCFAAGKKKRAITELVLFLLFLIIGPITSSVKAFIMARDPMSFYDSNPGAFSGYDTGYDYVMQSMLGSYLPALAFLALFLLCWIPDVVRIIKGTFANNQDEWPEILCLPKWKFTKKHLIAAAALVVLDIATRGLSGKIPSLLLTILNIPVGLSAVFFGPIVGALISGLTTLTTAAPNIITNFWNIITDIDHYGKSEIIMLLFTNLKNMCITALATGYLVCGIPKIPALKAKFADNKIMQGILIGTMFFVVNTAFLASLSSFHINYILSNIPSILFRSTLTGAAGVLLPLLLAKKGLLLGPFVKEGDSAAEGMGAAQERD